MTNLTQYDELSVKHEAAYAAFQRIYAAQNPPPAMAPEPKSDRWVTNALGGMLVASVIVSGSRTVTEFGGGVVGAAAFVMLEIGIVAYAYIGTRRNYSSERHQHVKRLTTLGIAVAFGVTLAANLHATIKVAAGEEAIASWINTLILIAIGVSAPTLAYVSGHLLGQETVRVSHERVRLQREYDEAMKAWREGLNRAWSGQKSRWGLSMQIADETPKLSVPSAPSASTQTDIRQTGYGFTRTSDGARRVVDHLQQHPADAELTLRVLGERVGVNKDTAAKGLRLWRESEVTNDHGN